MAHEFNNPTSLIMFNLPIVKRVWEDVLPLLKDTSRRGKPVEFGGYRRDFLERRPEPLIDDMAMAANRISKIVKDLRNFSRRSQVRDKAPVDINAAVAAARRLAPTTMRQSGVELTLDLAGDLPTVQGNPTAIEQVQMRMTAAPCLPSRFPSTPSSSALACSSLTTMPPFKRCWPPPAKKKGACGG